MNTVPLFSHSTRYPNRKHTIMKHILSALALAFPLAGTAQELKPTYYLAWVDNHSIAYLTGKDLQVNYRTRVPSFVSLDHAKAALTRYQNAYPKTATLPRIIVIYEPQQETAPDTSQKAPTRPDTEALHAPTKKSGQFVSPPKQ